MTHYNKSKIMKEAHRLRKVEGYTMSQALKLAWSKAYRSEYYQIIVVRKPVMKMTPDMLMAGAANYYASKNSGDYTGD